MRTAYGGKQLQYYYLVERVASDHSQECWFWEGGLSVGYGVVYVPKFKATKLAHRTAYIERHGEVPEGFELDHLCRNRACWNPDHLEPVTRSENIFRGDIKNRKVTHCLEGHEYTEENTYLYDNRRDCRICIRTRSREYMRRKRGYYD